MINNFKKPLGHLFAWHTPDKISERPNLYKSYVKNLAYALGARLGFKGPIDMYTFNYIANSRGNTEQNDAIFRTEIDIRQGKKAFGIDNSTASDVKDYLYHRNKHYGSTYHVITTEATVWRMNGNGDWYSTTETQSYVIN